MDIVRQSKDLAIWIQGKVDGLEISSDERTRVVASCFEMALEHQSAVTVLAEHRLFGSAFSLVRCAFEAYIRGLWLKHCASDNELSDFLHDRLKRGFGSLIRDVETVDGYSEGILSHTKDSTWALLNSFTHTGFNQIVRRNVEDAIQSNYSTDDVREVVRFVNSISILAGLEVAQLSKACSERLMVEFLEKAKEFGEIATDG